MLVGCTTATHRPARRAAPATADESSDGGTITLRPGQRLLVTLHSTSWKLATPTSTVVRLSGTPKAKPGADCPSIPGTGCGTLTAKYVARRAGTSVLAAHRDSCGEALRCVGTAGDWRVTLAVELSPTSPS